MSQEDSLTKMHQQDKTAKLRPTLGNTPHSDKSLTLEIIEPLSWKFDKALQLLRRSAWNSLP